MEIKEFISNYREAFSETAELPIALWYSDTPIAETAKIEGCFFKGMRTVRDGGAMSLNAGNIGCGGGKFYTGFTTMPAHVPDFVSLKERYKETPEMVLDHIASSEVLAAKGKYLNFARIDSLKNLEGIEALVFFATPDILAGLTSWVWFDNNSDGAVTTRFGSGCSAIVSDPVGENRRGGRRTFLGCFDISVRPHLAPDELSLAVPMSRFAEMYHTLRRSALFDTHAWPKLRGRI
jgi:hypothetical protein